MIVETELCHDRLSGSWKTRNAGGIIQSEAKGWSARWVIASKAKLRELWFQCPRAGKTDVSVQEENQLALPPPFCSVLALSGLGDACPYLQAWTFSTQSTESEANLFWKHPQQTYPEKPFYQPAGLPLAQSIKMNPHKWMAVLQPLPAMTSFSLLPEHAQASRTLTFGLLPLHSWDLGPWCSTYFFTFCILPWLICSFSLPL